MRCLSRLAVCGLALTTLTGCVLPGDPGSPGLGLSRQGESIVVHPPVCQVKTGAIVHVYSTFPGTVVADKELWSAQVAGEIAPGDAVLLDARNPDLTNVEGDYPPDARLVVTIDVVDDDEYDGGGTVRELPEQGVVYRGTEMTSAEYSAAVAQACESG